MCSPRLASFRLLVVIFLVSQMPGPRVYGWPPEVEVALERAEENRDELVAALMHFEKSEDKRKLNAIQWLITHMDGHGFIEAGFLDANKDCIAFDPLAFPDFAAAQAAFDLLEKKHGTLDYGPVRRQDDLQTITAAALIENVELAFEAWQTLPWAREVTYETFCDYLLAYRGSEEPVESFRPFMRGRYADLPQRMKNPSDPREAAAIIRADIDKLVAFNERYYLHPTDQGLQEMLQHGQGRCEDITNMVMYAWRANAIPAASDYTPAWADRDNNHAWEVILDAEGRGQAGLGSRAAKIYRKMFALQETALGHQLQDEEPAPRWLRGKHYADVTDQYQPVSDVSVELTSPIPEGSRFAYVCVFNGGEWTAIHFAPLGNSQTVTFTKLGRNIAYLPAYFVDETIRPAGPPFILHVNGSVELLDGSAAEPVEVELSLTQPEVNDADTRRILPAVEVQEGQTYEMFSWNPISGAWESHGTRVAGSTKAAFDKLPPGRLYWLKKPEGRNLERIFTVEAHGTSWY